MQNWRKGVTMTKGRKPTPTALKKVRGTDQPVRMNMNEAEYELLTKVTVPKVLGTKRAQQIFRDKSKQLMAQRILQAPDIDLLTAYANTFDLYLQAIEEQNKPENNLIISVITKSGTAKTTSPYIKLQRELLPLINNMGASFGFTPSSRARVSKPTQHDDNNGDFC